MRVLDPATTVPARLVVERFGQGRFRRRLVAGVDECPRGHPTFTNFKLTVLVPRLPKTRSGKILRGTIRKMADGEAFDTPSTIEDPTALAEIADALDPNATGA